MIRKAFVLLGAFFITQPFLFSQETDTITEKEVSRIIHYLASDSMKGRGNGRPELLKAGIFIGEEFKKNNLKALPGYPGYFLSFRPFGGVKEPKTDNLWWNGQPVSQQRFHYVHPAPGNYPAKTLRDFSVTKLDSFFTPGILLKYTGDTSSLLLWTDAKQPDGINFFPENIVMPAGGLTRNILLVYAESSPDSLLLKGDASYYSMLQYNVVGILPGKTRPAELIVFSAHYDHEGVYGGRRDSIMNGANDNASGTTAILMLAHYFSKRDDNERTIIFCAFSGEELGLLGSMDFIKKKNLSKIIAGINIEMIGVPEFGKNRVFITGEKYSNLPDILSKQLKSNGIRVRGEPNEDMQLFLRSDNYPFVIEGVPFHTIMGSDDYDKCYHQPCDEVKRIDIANMTRIIKAIAASAKTLISGEEAPRRIDKGSLPAKSE